MPGLSWGRGQEASFPAGCRSSGSSGTPTPGPTFWGTWDSERRGCREAAPLGQWHQELHLFTPARGTPCGVEGPARADGPRLPQAALGRPVHLQVERPRCCPPARPSLPAASTRLRGLLAHPPAALCPPTPFPGTFAASVGHPRLPRGSPSRGPTPPRFLPICRIPFCIQSRSLFHRNRGARSPGMDGVLPRAGAEPLPVLYHCSESAGSHLGSALTFHCRVPDSPSLGATTGPQTRSPSGWCPDVRRGGPSPGVLLLRTHPFSASLAKPHVAFTETHTPRNF